MIIHEVIANFILLPNVSFQRLSLVAIPQFCSHDEAYLRQSLHGSNRRAVVRLHLCSGLQMLLLQLAHQEGELATWCQTNLGRRASLCPTL